MASLNTDDRRDSTELRVGDLVILKSLGLHIDYDVDIYSSVNRSIYDPTGRISTSHVALVISVDSSRFVKIICQGGTGWIHGDELFVISSQIAV